MEIRVQGLNYVYSPKTPWQIRALSDVSFTIGSNRVLGILGVTGSGKTTLLKNINGLLAPTSGKIFLDGKDISLFQGQTPKLVGLVFQCPERQLFEETVVKEITFPLRIDVEDELEEKELLLMSRRVCDEVGLDLDQIGGLHPQSLTEASKRKLAIACVLVNNPKVLILDEPLAGMDPYSSLEIVKMVARMKSRVNRTIIIVSHDMAPFMTSLDLMMVLDKGRLASFGSCGDVLDELSSDPELFELAPPIAQLKRKLKENGYCISKDEFDPVAIVRQLSSNGPELKDIPR